MKSKTLATVLSTLFLGALAAGCATTSAAPEASAPDTEQAAKACSCCKGPCQCGKKSTEAAEAAPAEAPGGSAMAAAPEEEAQKKGCALSGCACGKPKS